MVPMVTHLTISPKAGATSPTVREIITCYPPSGSAPQRRLLHHLQPTTGATQLLCQTARPKCAFRTLSSNLSFTRLTVPRPARRGRGIGAEIPI